MYKVLAVVVFLMGAVAIPFLKVSTDVPQWLWATGLVCVVAALWRIKAATPADDLPRVGRGQMPSNTEHVNVPRIDPSVSTSTGSAIQIANVHVAADARFYQPKSPLTQVDATDPARPKIAENNPLEIGRNGDVVAAKTATLIPDTDDEEEIWGCAMQEIRGNNLKLGLWAKCFAEANGEEPKAQAAYLKARAAELTRDLHVRRSGKRRAEEYELAAERRRSLFETNENDLIQRLESDESDISVAQALLDTYGYTVSRAAISSVQPAVQYIVTQPNKRIVAFMNWQQCLQWILSVFKGTSTQYQRDDRAIQEEKGRQRLTDIKAGFASSASIASVLAWRGYQMKSSLRGVLGRIYSVQTPSGKVVEFDNLDALREWVVANF